MNSKEPYAADKAKKRKRKIKPIDDSIIAAFIAAIMSISERAVEELDCGKLKRILIEGAKGTIILSKTGEIIVIRSPPENKSNKNL